MVWLGWPALLLASIILAGCSEAPPPPDQTSFYGGGPEQEIRPGLGRIHGVATDDEKKPATNVNVTLLPVMLTAKTSSEGKFIFVNLQPYEYTLELNSTTFNLTTQKVQVKADDITTTEVTMIPLWTPPRPHQSNQTFDGNFRMTVRAGCVDAYPAPFFGWGSQSELSKSFSVPKGLAGVAASLVWDVAGANGASELSLRVSVPTLGTQTSSGASPVHALIRGEILGSATTVTVKVDLPTCKVGDPEEKVVDSQSFTVYVRFWYWAPPSSTALAYP